MKKQIKAAGGLIMTAAVFFSAGQARAEILAVTGAAAYMPHAAAGAAARRGAMLERLSEAADRLAVGGTGDMADAEGLLAGLYSGSVSAEAAPEVYAEAGRPSDGSALAAAPVARTWSAAGELEDAAGDGAGAAAPAVSGEDGEGGAEEGYSLSEYHGADDEEKPTFGSMLLAGIISMLIVAFFVLILL